jgi:hypothetical protein
VNLTRRIWGGRIEIHDEASRVEGDDLVMRSRIREYDGEGDLVRDEIIDGVRIENGALWRSLFP